VIEQDAVASIDTVSLAIVHGDPIGIKLRDGIGASRIKWGCLFLRCFLNQSVEFARTGLIKSGLPLKSQNANCFQ